MMLNERPESVYEVKTASRRVERQLDKVDDEIYSLPFHHGLPCPFGRGLDEGSHNALEQAHDGAGLFRPLASLL